MPSPATNLLEVVCISDLLCTWQVAALCEGALRIVGVRWWPCALQGLYQWNGSGEAMCLDEKRAVMGDKLLYTGPVVATGRGMGGGRE